MLCLSLRLFSGCGDRPFYFVQMADTQLGMINRTDDGNDFAAETAILERVMADINNLEPLPAFVIVCGDLTDTPGHAGQITEYKRLMGLLDPAVKYYNVSGNHDFNGNPNPENIAFYRKTYGSDRYNFTYRGWNFLIINSTLMKFPEGARKEADEQFEFARKTLETARDSSQSSLVFMHHPFFDYSLDEPDSYNNIATKDRRLWLDMFAENNVEAVFSGHRHMTIPEHDYRGVRLINTNAVCNSNDNRPGLRIAGIAGEEFTQKFHSINSLPDKIDYNSFAYISNVMAELIS